MTNSKETPELLQILNLEPEYKDQLHPYALKRYLSFLREINDKFSPGKLTAEDINLYLSEEERHKLITCATGIADWLVKCKKDSGKTSLLIHPFGKSPYYSMSRFKAILETIIERKVEKVRQEAEKKRRLAALEGIGPPIDDAEKYLAPEERQRFFDSIPGAINAYLGRDKGAESYSPSIWLLNSKASDYSHWTGVIEDRRKDEIRQKQAAAEYDRYLDTLSLTVEKFKTELAKSKKPEFVYPLELEKYGPDGWCELKLPDKQQLRNWAEDKILERLPSILANLTKWKLSWQLRVLPYATYEVTGVPCLTWCFNTHLLVAADLELKECVIRKRCPGGYTVKVQGEGEKLGTLYFGPVERLTPGSFTTPIALLSLLANGEREGPGITVTECSPPFTTFAVQGFDGAVEVCDDFRKFIKDIAKDKPLAEALLAKGLIGEDIAKLVEEKVKLPLPQLFGAGQTFNDDSHVIVALEAMGYKNEEIKEAMEDVSFPPTTPLEEKVTSIVKILDSKYT